MLEKVRKPGKAKATYKFVGYALLGVICLSFVFVGLSPNTVDVSGIGAAAVVNDEVISLYDFQRSYDQRQRFYSESWKRLPAERREQEQMGLRQQVLQDLVRRSLVFQNADATGMFPAKGALQEQILEIDAFELDGRFSREQYREVLRANRWTPKEFEQQLARDLSYQIGRDVFLQALKAPPNMDDLNQKASQTEVNLEFVKFDRKKLETAMKPSASEIENFINSEAGKKQIQLTYDNSGQEFVVNKESGEKKALKDVQTQIAADLLAAEVVDKELAGLGDKLKAGQSLKSFLKLAGAKWESTGNFNLTSTHIPKIGNEPDLLNTVLALGKPGKLVPQVVQAAGGSYIVKIKNLKAGETKGSSRPSFSTAGFEAFDGFVQELEKSARVQTNQALITQGI